MISVTDIFKLYVQHTEISTFLCFDFLAHVGSAETSCVVLPLEKSEKEAVIWKITFIPALPVSVG